MHLGIPNSQVRLTNMRQELQETHGLLGWQLEVTSNDTRCLCVGNWIANSMHSIETGKRFSWSPSKCLLWSYPIHSPVSVGEVGWFSHDNKRSLDIKACVRICRTLGVDTYSQTGEIWSQWVEKKLAWKIGWTVRLKGLDLAVSGTGLPMASSYRSHSCSPYYQHLDTDTQCIVVC